MGSPSSTMGIWRRRWRLWYVWTCPHWQQALTHSHFNWRSSAFTLCSLVTNITHCLVCCHLLCFCDRFRRKEACWKRKTSETTAPSYRSHCKVFIKVNSAHVIRQNRIPPSETTHPTLFMSKTESIWWTKMILKWKHFARQCVYGRVCLC